MAALALLTLPLEWILAAVTAAAIHECCHVAALRICGVRIFGFSAGSEGARIETEPMGRWQELCCALAGPVGSFLLVLLIRWVPLISICALFHGLYNLLPVYPLDGGRVLCCLAGRKTAEAIAKWTVICLIFCGIYFIMRLKLGFGAMILLFLLIRKLHHRKIPCKDDPQAVQ